MTPIILGNKQLTLEDVLAVAQFTRPVQPLQPRSGDPEADLAYARVLQSRAWVEQVLARNDRAYYGINTGFGIKAGRIPLDKEDIPWLSRNLIVSHASGVGNFLHPEIVRAAMLIRAHSLAQGFSGVRPELINTLVQMLNMGIVPVVPELGSVGSSGDLAPLSHLAQVVSKRPEATNPAHELPTDLPADYDESGLAMVLLQPNEPPEYLRTTLKPKEILTLNGRTYALLSGAQAMQFRGVPQLTLTAKEGLGLNNGATFSAAIAVLTLLEAENCLRHAEIGLALSLEALLGFRDAFLPQVQQVRGFPGQIAVAERIWKLLEGSHLADGDLEHDPLILPPQDAYSLRTAPQTFGAMWDTMAFVRQTLTTEINAATDNPLIFDVPAGHPLHLPRPYKTISGGNFHGTPIGYAMDFLKIVLADLGSMCERRVYRLVNQDLNHGLPSMLVEEKAFGQTSGMMIPQYLASAIVSKCKTLAHPDSVDSIPTSAGREDFVSMSMNAALHARQVVQQVSYVVAIELLCAFLGVTWRQRQLNSLLADPTFDPEPKLLEDRTRVDEHVLHLRRIGQQAQTGRGTTQAIACLDNCLYGPGRALPDLNKEPATIDRFTQPYLLRIYELLQSQELLKVCDL